MFDEEDTIGAWWAQQEMDERFIREQLEKCMPKTSEMIQSKFLRKEDLDDDTRVTIKGVRLEDMGQQGAQEQRWVIYFKEFQKGMVLNVTTIRVLEAAFGDDSDGWVGKPVMLYVDPNVSFQGRVVGGLRLRTPRKAQASAPAPKPADDEFADDVPF
jgi:hypothetical protein